MAVSYVEYELQSGYITNWLVAGPQEIPAGSNDLKINPEYKKEIAKKYYTARQEISAPPVERGPLHEGVFSIGDYRGEWRYYHCREDRLVDLSGSFQTGAFVRAWAFAQLLWQDNVEATFTVSTEGPVDIWINKKLALHAADFPGGRTAIEFRAPLKKGMNKVLLRMANVAGPNAVLAAGLAVDVHQTSGSVRIPTLIPSLSRRNQLEAVFDQIYMEREIHAPGNKITLVYPESFEEPTYTDVRLQTSSGRIYGQVFDTGKPGEIKILGSPAGLPNTTYQVLVTPRDWELYESNIRITQCFDVWSLGRQRFSAMPYGDLDSRRKEALAHAATVEDSLYAEIAKIALADWDNLEQKTLKKAIESIQHRRAGNAVDLLGLLGVLARYGDRPEIPEWLKGETEKLAVHFEYSPERATGQGDHSPSEDSVIVLHACAILAGQLFPAEIFSFSDQPGEQLRQEGEKAALSWMKKRGNYGFAAWDSKELYTQILAALSYLIDLAQCEEVWELASVLMDKILFSIALNSHQGVYGSSQGCATTLDIKSGLLEPTSGITRLMWGMGVFNQSIAGTVSLACMANYELPPVIAEIAAGRMDTLLNKEQQADSAVPVNKITYRTPDYMLSSAQSYRPGEPGNREHIWQATLGPQSIVFVNHPGCSTEDDAHTPNYWLGNGALPRVAQHENMLVEIVNIPDDSAMDFTHAYFPVIEFDEFVIHGSTAFARKGDGYIALTAVNGLEQVTTGRTAFREIRSPGRQNIWICQMGRAVVDGEFGQFQDVVKGQKISAKGLNVELNCQKGDILQFGWEDHLLYNDLKQGLNSFPHYENPYATAFLPCPQLDIHTSDSVMRLKFDELPSE